MRKVSVFELTPGMILGEDILNFDRQTILAKGTVLSDTYIARIELNGTLDVFIMEESDSGETDASSSVVSESAVTGSIHTLTADADAEEKISHKSGTLHTLTADDSGAASVAAASGSKQSSSAPGSSTVLTAPSAQNHTPGSSSVIEDASAHNAANPVFSNKVDNSYHVRPTLSNKTKKSFSFQKFKAEYNAITDNFKFKINEMVDKNVAIDTKELLKEPLELISAAGSNNNTLHMLHNMRDYDDLTFAHSMNVALLNYVAAGWLGWNEARKELAMACGLLHDIGKLKVSHSILTKPGKLDNEEYQHIQKHPVFGYKLLKSKGLSDHIVNSALMHHERYDGTGYPLSLKGDEIDMYARLTAISDVYDAMTAARCYRGPLCPFRVIEIFESEGFDKYDTKFILSFLSNVGETYVKNGCILSDGREAEIIMINPNRLSRPVVRIDDSTYVDLREHPDLTIESII